MKKLKKHTEIIEIPLVYYTGEDNPDKGIFVGKVEQPKYLDELIMDIGEDEYFDEQQDAFIANGKIQLVISGSNRALAELGKYLINISRYPTQDPDYHDHFEYILDSQKKDYVHLIVKKVLNS